MSVGSMYVRLDANVANGNMNLNISEPITSGGGQENGYWLYWTENGYTNLSWYWDEEDNYVREGWIDHLGVPEGQTGTSSQCWQSHTANEAGLSEHIRGGHAEELNLILGPWPPPEKMRFVGRHYEQFEDAGCLVAT